MGTAVGELLPTGCGYTWEFGGNADSMVPVSTHLDAGSTTAGFSLMSGGLNNLYQLVALANDGIQH
jgi:hypothetical protein